MPSGSTQSSRTLVAAVESVAIELADSIGPSLSTATALVAASSLRPLCLIAAISASTPRQKQQVRLRETTTAFSTCSLSHSVSLSVGRQLVRFACSLSLSLSVCLSNSEPKLLKLDDDKLNAPTQ